MAVGWLDGGASRARNAATRRAARPASVTLASAVLALAVIATATGCSGSGYRYVNNSSEKTFFKLPTRWELYRVNLSSGTSGSSATSAPAAKPWQVIFDSSLNPSAKHLDDTVPTSPVGTAEVIPLSQFQYRDEVSQKNLRAWFFNGKDPVELAQGGDTSVAILSYKEITTSAGARGNRIVVTLTQEDGKAVTIDQTAMVNKAVDRVYRLTVKCEASCFAQRRREISTITDSWQVRA